MSEAAIICLTMLALIWLGWPLHSIASDFRALRKMAERKP
jgi:hypothetical protein